MFIDLRNIAVLWNYDESGIDGRSPFSGVRVIARRGRHGARAGVVVKAHRDHYTLCVAVCSDGSHSPVAWICATDNGSTPSTAVSTVMMMGCTAGARLFGTGTAALRFERGAILLIVMLIPGMPIVQNQVG